MPEPSDVVTIIARLRQCHTDQHGPLTLYAEAADLIEALCAELAHHAGWRP